MIFAQALYDNESEYEDELAFRKGEILQVISRNNKISQNSDDFSISLNQSSYNSNNDGWWLCIDVRGNRGVAPANRLRVLTPHFNHSEEPPLPNFDKVRVIACQNLYKPEEGDHINQHWEETHRQNVINNGPINNNTSILHNNSIFNTSTILNNSAILHNDNVNNIEVDTSSLILAPSNEENERILNQNLNFNYHQSQLELNNNNQNYNKEDCIFINSVVNDGTNDNVNYGQDKNSRFTNTSQIPAKFSGPVERQQFSTSSYYTRTRRNSYCQSNPRNSSVNATGSGGATMTSSFISSTAPAGNNTTNSIMMSSSNSADFSPHEHNLNGGVKLVGRLKKDSLPHHHQNQQQQQQRNSGTGVHWIDLKSVQTPSRANSTSSINVDFSSLNGGNSHGQLMKNKSLSLSNAFSAREQKVPPVTIPKRRQFLKNLSIDQLPSSENSDTNEELDEFLDFSNSNGDNRGRKNQYPSMMTSSMYNLPNSKSKAMYQQNQRLTNSLTYENNNDFKNQYYANEFTNNNSYGDINGAQDFPDSSFKMGHVIKKTPVFQIMVRNGTIRQANFGSTGSSEKSNTLPNLNSSYQRSNLDDLISNANQGQRSINEGQRSVNEGQRSDNSSSQFFKFSTFKPSNTLTNKSRKTSESLSNLHMASQNNPSSFAYFSNSMDFSHVSGQQQNELAKRRQTATPVPWLKKSSSNELIKTLDDNNYPNFGPPTNFGNKPNGLTTDSVTVENYKELLLAPELPHMTSEMAIGRLIQMKQNMQINCKRLAPFNSQILANRQFFNQTSSNLRIICQCTVYSLKEFFTFLNSSFITLLKRNKKISSSGPAENYEHLKNLVKNMAQNLYVVKQLLEKIDNFYSQFDKTNFSNILIISEKFDNFYLMINQSIDFIDGLSNLLKINISLFFDPPTIITNVEIINDKISLMELSLDDYDIVDEIQMDEENIKSIEIMINDRFSNLSEQDREIIQFYEPQVENHVIYLNSAIDDFFQTFELKEPAKKFVNCSRFVVLAAHKLIYIGDNVSQCVKHGELNEHVKHYSDRLCHVLKLYVLATKTAALQYPCVQSVQNMFDAIVEISSSANDLKLLLSSLNVPKMS